jgi:hypothetical protein
MHKCEIFDCSDCHDFYIIKPFWVCDFEAKIETRTLIFGRARHHLISDAHAKRAHQFLPRMLRVRIRKCAYAQHVLKVLRSVRVLVPDSYAQRTHQFLTHMLSVRISS